jgi:hypothetical protein
MFLLESCSSSSLVDVWNDPSYSGAPLKKILVMAIRKDLVQRRIWEDAFVTELSNNGIKAVSSYELFPSALPDSNQVDEAIKEKAFDGILITRLLQKETEETYIEGYTTREARTKYNPFINNYTTYFKDIYHPAYVESQIINRRAIEVWAIGNIEGMIWAATSNTPMRNINAIVEDDVAKLVVEELINNGFVKIVSK